jgi:tight adherence protein B
VSPLLVATSAALVAAAGVHLLYGAFVYGQNEQTATPRSRGSRRGGFWRTRLTEAGLGEARTRDLAGAVAMAGALGAFAGFMLFGGVVPALATGAGLALLPIGSLRARRRRRLEVGYESWPRLLGELRLRTGSLGRSIPQALFEVGDGVPREWAAAFASAEREWLLTTDFTRTVALLKRELADPTADVVCETLLVAHEVGSTDLDGRLSALIEDREVDVQSRKDASSRLAGVRFARRFVLLVPLGMTLAGLTIGDGRHAYSTQGGQLAVVIGLLAVVGCWVWSGRLMRLPPQPRVFS